MMPCKQKSFSQYATAHTIYDVIKNFLQTELISTTVRDRRREDLEADQDEKKDISLSLSRSLSYTC